MKNQLYPAMLLNLKKINIANSSALFVIHEERGKSLICVHLAINFDHIN